jgi:hypothetical protein
MTSRTGWRVGARKRALADASAWYGGPEGGLAGASGWYGGPEGGLAGASGWYGDRAAERETVSAQSAGMRAFGLDLKIGKFVPACS